MYCNSDKNGIVEFLTESPLSGINSIAASSIHNSNLFNNIAEIPSKKLDSLFNFSNEVLAFKIDLEGHEFHVLEGAKNLLAKNQCILQCENYSNATGDIRKLLSRNGYERISNISSDNYYTNNDSLLNSGNDLIILESAIGKYIDYNLGRWRTDPRTEGIMLLLEIDGDYVKCKISVSDFFSHLDPEYAFYLYVDKNLVCEIPYQKISEHNFLLTDFIKMFDGSHVVSVSGFVRDSTLIAKKVSTNVTLNSLC